MIGIFSRITTLQLPLPIWFYATLGLTVFLRSRHRWTWPNFLDLLRIPAPIHTGHFTLFTLMTLAILRVMFFFSENIGAIGLDTHQHIHWTNQILEAGFLPLTEQGTKILSPYTKGLHSLAAIWTAAGGLKWGGPYLKMMPFVQNILPALILSEIYLSMCSALSARTIFLSIANALVLIAGTFIVIRGYYPVFDLNGTGRSIAALPLLTPLVLFGLGAFFKSQILDAAAILLLPVMGAFALTINPSLIFGYVGLTVPIALIPSVKFCMSSGRWRAKAGLASFGLAMLVVCSDPYWMTWLAKSNIGYSLEFLHRMDLHLPDYSKISQNTLTSRPSCTDLSCGLTKVYDASMTIWRGLSSFVKIQLIDPGAFYKTKYADRFYNTWYALIIISMFIVIFVKKKNVIIYTFIGFLTMWVGLFLNSILAAMLDLVVDKSSFEQLLLALYVHQGFPVIISISLAYIVSVAAISAPLCSLDTSKIDRTLKNSLTLLIPLGALAACVSLFSPVELDSKQGFTDKISVKDLWDLRHIEQLIPESDRVIFPAFYRPIGHERWILPQTSTGSYMPYGRRRYLFNVQLGESIQFGWRDLVEHLCSDDPATRRTFFSENGIKWLVAAGQQPESLSFFQSLRFCDNARSLEDLGVIFPPVSSEYGKLALFRIDPSRIVQSVRPTILQKEKASQLN